MDLIGLLDRTMIPDFPISDSGFRISEICMAYGESGIPHHEVPDPRGAHERHMRSAGTGDGGGRTRDVLPWSAMQSMSYLGMLCK